jgi:hypothetical protein
MTLSIREAHTVIGAIPGEIAEVPSWAMPGWMDRLDVDPLMREYWPSFEVVFVVSRFRGERALKVATPIVPGRRIGAATEVPWARAVLALPVDHVGERTKALVSSYGRCAREILDGA